jgi:XTP/dITP diphosphohydrolase
MRPLLVATRNPGKAREIAQMLQGFRVLSLSDYPDLLDVAETGATFLDNALLKARYCAEATGELTLADDSGLIVDALGGAPGVMSSRYAPTDAERIAKLLAATEGIPECQRSARFVCAIAAVEPDGVTVMAEGKVEGSIGRAPRGGNGFGYDPIFLVDGTELTMAELPSETKNSMSHRGTALAKVLPLVRVLLGERDQRPA